MSKEPTFLVGGLAWPESPRWRNGSLYISDVHNFRLIRVANDGGIDTVCNVEGRPAGMDFAADGSILLATGVGKELLRVDPSTGKAAVVATLGGEVGGFLNDMITHSSGWSWIGDTGFRFGVDEPARKGSVFAYHPDYGCKRVVEDVFFPNGMAIHPDGTVVYIAETFGKCISAFDIGNDGLLSNRRTHVSLPGEIDGLCMDGDGFLWAALLFKGDFLRIAPHGEIVETVSFPGKNAIACVLGGNDDRTIFLTVCRVTKDSTGELVRNGEIYSIALDASGRKSEGAGLGV